MGASEGKGAPEGKGASEGKGVKEGVINRQLSGLPHQKLLLSPDTLTDVQRKVCK
jgi:hypothetical protein